MAALRNRCGHYIFPCCFFYLLLFSSIFFISSPNLSRRKWDVCHTSTHGVALVRIYDAGVKHAARGPLKIQDEKWLKKIAICAPSNNFFGLSLRNKGMYRQSEKLVKQQYLLHMALQYVAKYSDERVCMYVCLSVCPSVCLSARISQKRHDRLRNFLRMLPVAVSVAFSGDNGICYILLFLWMTIFSYNRTDHSCFLTLETGITIKTTRTTLTRVYLLGRIPQPRHIDIGTMSLPAISKCVRVLVYKY